MDSESGLVPDLRKQVEVAFAATPESEIIPDDELAHTEAADQQALDKLGRRQTRQRPIETQAQNPIHTGARQFSQLLRQSAEPGRCPFGSEVFLGRGLESDDRNRQAQRPGQIVDLLQYGAVPQMHAIVVPDRRDTAKVRRTEVVDTSDQFHDQPVVKGVDYKVSAEHVTASSLGSRKCRRRTPRISSKAG